MKQCIDRESNSQFGIIFWQPNGLPEFGLEQLKAELANKRKFDYLFFWGHQVEKRITKSCFSQWWKVFFLVDGNEYCCMEQYMMAEKARLFKGDRVRRQVLKETDPKTIKRLGREVHNFVQDIWDECKYSIVLNGNYAKFSQNEELLDFLLATNNQVLVEASPYDTIWGVGIDGTNPQINNPFFWKGQNLLGFALMEVRNKLIHQI